VFAHVSYTSCHIQINNGQMWKKNYVRTDLKKLEGTLSVRAALLPLTNKAGFLRLSSLAMA